MRSGCSTRSFSEFVDECIVMMDNARRPRQFLTIAVQDWENLMILKTVRSRLSAYVVFAMLFVDIASLGLMQPCVAFSEELTIAAASDLNYAFKGLVAAYEKKTGQHVKLTLGSSGNFFSQISNGAPFDLYFSADIRYPQKLEEVGHAVPGSLYKYAVGRIVLWTPMESKVDVQKGLDALADPAVKKIAIANPKHAPYGRA